MLDNQFRLPLLTRDNYADWKELFELTLAYLDLYLTITEDEPPALINASTPDERTYHKRWTQSNRMSLKFIRAYISKNIRGSIPTSDKAKKYLKSIDDQFIGIDKSIISTLIAKFSSLNYNGKTGVRDHIMKMRDTVVLLKEMEVEIPDEYLVHHILNSLPTEYGAFKVSYNTQQQKWTVDELMNMCFQEEQRLKSESKESAHLTTFEKGQSIKSKKYFQE
ncbi:uncharacterized protein LOC122672578 [Telopea speciosissima]|uniref:uncharacterized protein LOC122672578 n=1 Tax=Telopea speciosissima TaxID=54955 RepID=UPI001CC82CA5|nr:uncharacterized protein LOC122672578 [Telopea speciosissima]